MKAAVLKAKGLICVEDLEKPNLEATDVLVKVKASGLCRTDIHHRDFPNPSLKLPRVIGHEIAGEVAEKGSKLIQFEIGEKVIVSIYITCNKCVFCESGRENLCPNVKRIGFDVDGGHAEFVKVPNENIFRIPENVSFEHGAVLPDAVGVMLHAIRTRAKVKSNDIVVIQGIGGLGIHGVQIAKLYGANVIAIDTNPQKLNLALKYGASKVIDSRNEDAIKKIKEFTNNTGVDIVIDTVGQSDTLEKAIYYMGRGGRLVLLAYESPVFKVDTSYVFHNEIEMLGSRACTKSELLKVINLVKEGKIIPVVSRTYELDEINIAMADLQEGRILGRAVIVNK